VAIGAASGAFCCFLLVHFHQAAGDFGWTLYNVQHLLARQNPYDTSLEQYPLTSAVFGWPFVWMRPELAGGLFYGISSALLAFGVTRHGYHRLLIFLAYPYWAGLLAVQWSTLIAATAFFPLLLPAALAKPQVGLPVAITHLSRRGVLACIVIVLISLMVMPRWPWLWLGQARHYQYFVPLIVLPGPLLALALWRYRQRDAWLLLLTAIMPQRWFFDAFILWLIPKSRREILFTAALSWATGIWRWHHIPQGFTEVGRFTVAFIYLPMLAVILLRPSVPAESGPGSAVPETPSAEPPP
jgi:hypothetical protein